MRKIHTIALALLALTATAQEEEDYERRLHRLPCVIDMPYNQAVRQQIEQQCAQRATASAWLGRGNIYTPIFEEALEAKQLPLELRCLPVIESALDPAATSRAGAAGLWQLMLETARQYGLEVTSLVDERRDPVKASAAATSYLRDLHATFGDWTLAIAAYNCGPSNVNKAIKRAGGATDYWQICRYLPQETQNYVPAFIAANYVMTYYCHHDIAPARVDLPAQTDTIMLSRNVRMEQVSELTGVPLAEVQALNPQYRTTLIPGDARPCPLRLSPEAVLTLLEKEDSLAADVPAPVEIPVADKRGASGNPTYVTVRNGDTLGAIAKRNGTTVNRIKSLNGLKNNNIRIGQSLRVK